MSVATFAAAQLLRVLPRTKITRAVGKLADARVAPGALSQVVNLFARAYSVDLDEAITPDEGFKSFDDFFTRHLRPGARPMPARADAFVSPADGRIDAMGKVMEDGEMTVKGRRYSAAELLGSFAEARRYEGGQFAVVYLSPRDYHRVHSPVAGSISLVRSMPGDLFPVNSIGERHVPSLFAINRRVAIVIETETHGRVTVVMVGAMIVGRITVSVIDERDVSYGSHAIQPAREIARGEEIGIFHLGSTAVIFAEPSVPTWTRPMGPVRLGEALRVEDADDDARKDERG